MKGTAWKKGQGEGRGKDAAGRAPGCAHGFAQVENAASATNSIVTTAAAASSSRQKHSKPQARTDVGALGGAGVDGDDDATLENESQGGCAVVRLHILNHLLLEALQLRAGQEGNRGEGVKREQRRAVPPAARPWRSDQRPPGPGCAPIIAHVLHGWKWE